MWLTRVRRGICLNNKFLRHIKALNYIRQTLVHKMG